MKYLAIAVFLFGHPHEQIHHEPVHCCYFSNKDLQIVGYFAPIGKATLRPFIFGKAAMTSNQPSLFVAGIDDYVLAMDTCAFLPKEEGSS